MNIWIIVSWVFVAILTGVNVFVFLKLKKAGDQMMQMAFPGAKNMNEAMAKFQQMASSMGKMGGMPGMGRGGMPGGMGGISDAQMKQAMQMLQQMQGGGPKRR